MTTYSITLNENSVQGQALLAYLEALQVKLTRVTKQRTKRKNALDSSEEDIKAGRIKKFDTADEMCKALGI